MLPQVVPRTSSSNNSRTSPKDPIWPSRGCHNLTLWGHPESTSRGSANLTLKRRPREADSRRLQDVLRTSPRGSSEYSNLDVAAFFRTFFQALFDWSNLSKSISTLKMYWEPSETSKMEHFLQNLLMTL